MNGGPVLRILPSPHPKAGLCPATLLLLLLLPLLPLLQLLELLLFLRSVEVVLWLHCLQACLQLQQPRTVPTTEPEALLAC